MDDDFQEAEILLGQLRCFLFSFFHLVDLKRGEIEFSPFFLVEWIIHFPRYFCAVDVKESAILLTSSC